MTTKQLTDTQLVILSAAAQRADRAVLPLPKTLKPNKAAITKVLKSLIAKKLIEERQAMLEDEVWREEKDGARLTLAITDEGLEALGIVPEGGEPKKARATGRKTAGASGLVRKGKGSPQTKPFAKTVSDRSPTKQAIMIDLLKRKQGATIDELVTATGWQAHSLRGAISGTLKKKLGLAISSVNVQGRGRVYSIGVEAREGGGS